MSGEDMNSASILMTLAPAASAAPATTGVEQVLPGIGSFDLALAGMQSKAGVAATVEDTEQGALELASSLLVRGMLPDGKGVMDAAPTVEAGIEGDDVPEDGAASGVAAILAQMLAGSPPLAGNEAPPAADAAVQATSLPSAAPVSGGAKPVAAGAVRVGKAAEGGSNPSGEDPGAAPDAIAATLDAIATDPRPAASIVLQEKSFESPAGGAQQLPSPAQSGNSAQAVAQSAANALRDAVPAANAAVPVHATLREPVGSARWADELGNHLVLMSVRGQQQGSLTLTPEHLGPVEVQISMNRETANVWFGAQHADTRAALAEAMPRLRELLASSGLSLGHSGVSEQAPRENPPSPAFLSGSGPRGIEADVVAEKAAPAWRVWRPGLLDTYA